MKKYNRSAVSSASVIAVKKMETKETKLVSVTLTLLHLSAVQLFRTSLSTCETKAISDEIVASNLKNISTVEICNSSLAPKKGFINYKDTALKLLANQK